MTSVSASRRLHGTTPTPPPSSPIPPKPTTTTPTLLLLQTLTTSSPSPLRRRILPSRCRRARRRRLFISRSTKTKPTSPSAPTTASGSTTATPSAATSTPAAASASSRCSFAETSSPSSAVADGPDPQYPTNKVMIWDDHQGRCIGEISFRSLVCSVRLRRDRIVVVLEHKIFVYNFADLKLLHQIETFANPNGLCAVLQVASSLVLVCPGLQKWQVRVEHYASKRTKLIMAHDSRLACFALTPDGQLLATASSKGTLVRIFNTRDGSLLQEVRRGADRAEICSLAFSSTAHAVAGGVER